MALGIWIVLICLLLIPLAIASFWVGIEIKCDIGQADPSDPSDESPPEDGPVHLWLYLMGIRIRLFPKKKKKVNVRDFRIAAFRKRRRKEEKKKRRALLKKEKKKQSKNEKKKTEKPEEPKKPEEKKKKSLRESVSYIMKLLRKVVLAVLKKFGRDLRLDVCDLSIAVATGDAAKTAVAYRAVAQSVSCLLALLTENTHTRSLRSSRVEVIPDFVSETSRIHVHLRFRLRIHHILSLAFTALKGFLSTR